MLGPGLNVLVLLCLVVGLLAPFRHGASGRVLDGLLAGSDFGAFYCAAAIVRQGEDPYALAPLAACEGERVYAPGGASLAANGIDPAPLPPYDFALFAPFTFAPYRVAGVLWTGLLVAATLLAAGLLARLAGLPFWLVLAALALNDGLVCYTYGQLAPLVTLALVAAAALLQAGRPAAAALAAGAVCIEPHVGSAALLALAIWCPRARAAAAAVAVGLAAVALALCGPATNLEYFIRVLPVHAFAEIPLYHQYSLTALLYDAGLPGPAALRLGSLQYAAFAALGLAAAGPLRRRLGSPALVLFPVACVVTGGPFIHITQIASALPFGLFAAGRAPGISRWAWLGTVLVALPWPAYGGSSTLFAIDAVLMGGAGFAVWRTRPPALRALASAAAFGIYLASGPAFRLLPSADLRPPESPATVAAAGFDPRLASTDYALSRRRHPVAGQASPRRLAVRIPTWAGLLLLIGTGVAALRRPKP